MQSLYNYKLNLVKTGVILQELRDSRKMSRSYVADSIGVSTDVIGNLEKGLGGLSLERSIKLCVLYEIPIVALELLIVKDEDIDFRDSILVYDHQNDDATPITDKSVPEVPGVIPDSVVEAAASVDANAPHITHDFHIGEHKAMLDTLLRVQAEHLADLREQLARQDQIIRQLISKDRG